MDDASPDDIAFWAARWKEGKIGFHEGRANTFLERHVDRLGRARRILVPLCGKSEDMAFLASRGHQVVGIEAVEDAVVAFFREHDLVPEVTGDKRIRSYSAGGVTILAGDVFACTREDVGAVDSLYDRAALVALSAEARGPYVAHLRRLLAAGTGAAVSALVITFDYRQEKMSPPPFAVGEADVRALYAGAELELVDQGPPERARFREEGIDAMELCFAVTL